MPTLPPVLNGVAAADQQPPRGGEDESGGYTIVEWHGPLSTLQDVIPIIEVNGGLWELRRQAAIHILEARFPWNYLAPSMAVIDNWEYFAGDIEKDLLEADTDIINALTTTEKEQIRGALVNPDPNTVPAWPSNNSLIVFTLMQRGLRSARVAAPTVRHTQTFASIYSFVPNYSNVGKIVSTDSILAPWPIPASGTKVSWGTDPDINLVYGWYKKHPNIASAARAKTQLSYEWEYGLWATPPYQDL